MSEAIPQPSSSPAVTGNGPASPPPAAEGSAGTSPALPTATVAQQGLRLGWYWLLPLMTVAIVAVVLVLAWSRSGVTITLRFTEGHGLKPGDAVRCHGIIVGEVRKVRLDPDTGDVLVEADLHREASDLARSGSQFWIARPQADLAIGITGLDTVVGAKYIHVVPGAGGRQYEFVGLEAPPIPETIEKGGLEVVLKAHRLAGLRAGAPVTFRQVRVGSVLRVGLASDASAVEVHVYIRPAYARLVRGGKPKTVFWNTSGLRLEWQKWKPSLSVESAESVLVGGVALATPDPKEGSKLGKAAVSGDHFELLSKEPEGWEEWKPSLPLTDARLPEKAIMPRPVGATLAYQIPGRVVGKWSYTRRGLVIPIGRDLLGPSDLLTVPKKGKEAKLSLDMQPPPKVPVGPARTERTTVLRLASALDRAEGKAPALRIPTGPEECLLVGASDKEPRRVSVARLTVVGEEWEVDTALLRDTRPQEWQRQWHGAAIVALKDGAVIGLLRVSDRRKAFVLPLDEKTLPAPK
jgi:hypothetical protein